ncbi:NAD-dependent epimerase/dehydratase family protein [Paenibacillus glycanilyticus]|uniref:Epimerase n=1 Tax=Paenibacillus glycanilyticus TaxID=126569 RepID=A0ABQ6GI66_9BACL|nr:NAD-dependent epimerase/dehydratase family protein [Paenibacillus glycanilyticus]GLX69953.1 epimerase [Paenibacillus glycanilyticus]
MAGTKQKVKAIVTGATGMVGEGVLMECLRHPDVEQVLVVSRRPCGVTHPKLKEIIHSNFHDLTPIEEELRGYNACYFCLGVSSVGMSEADYTRVTYDLTMHVAGLLAGLNPDMVFCYVTGSGTDSTEKGSRMWARVKGKTENDLMKLPFRRAFMFRPCYMHPTKGQTRVPKWASAVTWLYPLLRPVFPNHLITLRQVGLAMIQTSYTAYERHILDPKDIIALAKEGGGQPY